MEERKSTRTKINEILFRGVEGAIACGLIGAAALSSGSPMYPTAEWIMKGMPIIGALLGMISKILEEVTAENKFVSGFKPGWSLEEVTTQNKFSQKFEPGGSLVAVISRKLLRAISRGIKWGIKTFVYGVLFCAIMTFISTLCMWDLMLREGPVEMAMRSVAAGMFLTMPFTIMIIISGVIDGFQNPEDTSKW